jgi:hypothetical protein
MSVTFMDSIKGHEFIAAFSRNTWSSLLSIFQTIHYPKEENYVRFEVFKAMAINNAVFWDVSLCGSCKNRRFGGTYRLHHQGDRNRRARYDVSSN